MNKAVKIIGLILPLALLIVPGAFGQNNHTHGKGEIIRAEVLSESMPPFPSDIYSSDSLVNWGMKSGKRYLVIVDVTRRRVVLYEQFTFEKEAKRIFQAAPHDNINDADLHISAPEKLRIFSALESELAKKLADKIRSVTSLR